MREVTTWLCGKTYPWSSPDAAALFSPMVRRIRLIFEIEGEPPLRDDSWKVHVVIPPPEGWTG